jgi:hypothetical protein
MGRSRVTRSFPRHSMCSTKSSKQVRVNSNTPIDPFHKLPNLRLQYAQETWVAFGRYSWAGPALPGENRAQHGQIFCMCSTKSSKQVRVNSNTPIDPFHKLPNLNARKKFSICDLFPVWLQYAQETWVAFGRYSWAGPALPGENNSNTPIDPFHKLPNLNARKKFVHAALDFLLVTRDFAAFGGTHAVPGKTEEAIELGELNVDQVCELWVSKHKCGW